MLLCVDYIRCSTRPLLHSTRHVAWTNLISDLHHKTFRYNLVTIFDAISYSPSPLSPPSSLSSPVHPVCLPSSVFRPPSSVFHHPLPPPINPVPIVKLFPLLIITEHSFHELSSRSFLFYWDLNSHSISEVNNLQPIRSYYSVPLCPWALSGLELPTHISKLLFNWAQLECDLNTVWGPIERFWKWCFVI